jgi:Arc/MetJ family transcription regulator
MSGKGYRTIMNVTVNLSADEVVQIKRATEVDDEKEAVAKAVREFLRVAALRELKAASGKVDYVGVEEEMEALELRERKPGQ